MKYVRVKTFALKSSGGGHWEDDVVISGKDYEDAFNQALDFLKKQGWSYSAEISICNKNGEDFQ